MKIARILYSFIVILYAVALIIGKVYDSALFQGLYGQLSDHFYWITILLLFAGLAFIPMQEFDKGSAKTILTSMVFALDALFSLFTLLIFIDTIKNLVPSTIIAFVALVSHVCFIPSIIIDFEEGKGIFAGKDKKESEGKMYVVEKEIKLENGEILNVGKMVLAKPNGEIKYTNKDGQGAFAIVPLNHLKKYKA